MNSTNSVKEEKDSGGVAELSPVSLEHGSLIGRELDAAVAERVMGWTIAPEGDRWRVSATGDYCNSWCVDSPSLAALDSDTSEPLYGRYAMPAYSSDMAAAMEVVEKFPFPATVTMERNRFYYNTKTDDGWRVNIQTSIEQGYAICNSLPEAICRAALQAVALNEPKEKQG